MQMNMNVEILYDTKNGDYNLYFNESFINSFPTYPHAKKVAGEYAARFVQTQLPRSAFDLLHK